MTARRRAARPRPSSRCATPPTLRASSPAHPMPAFMFVWDFLALDDDPTSTYGADGPADRADHRGLRRRPGRAARRARRQGADRQHQHPLHARPRQGRHPQPGRARNAGGRHGRRAAGGAGDRAGPRAWPRHLQLRAAQRGRRRARFTRTSPAPGPPPAPPQQADVTHKLLSLIQSGAIVGLDTTRTLTADGALGTRSFHDFRACSPNQADIVVFPQDDWTLNQVDATNTLPGPFQRAHPVPLRPPRRLLRRRALRPAHHGRAGVQERRDAAPPGLAPRGGADGAGRPRRGKRSPCERRRAVRSAALSRRSGRDHRGARPARQRARPGARGERLRGDAAGPAVAVTKVMVLLDVAGLYDDELFDDPRDRPGRRPAFRALAAAGTRFEDCWTESRDWPVSEYQMLAGGYPVAPFVAAAEDDPTITSRRAAGLLAMPPPANLSPIPTAPRPGARRRCSPAAACSTPRTALGLTAACSGPPDFHTLHVDPRRSIRLAPAAGRARGAARRAGGGEPGRPAGGGGVGGTRTPDRHSGQARAELQALASAAQDVFAGGARRAVGHHQPRRDAPSTSGCDFYGPGIVAPRAAHSASGPACATGSSTRPARHARRFAGHRPLRAGGGDRDGHRRRHHGHRQARRWRPAADPQHRHAGHALLRAFATGGP